MKHFVFLLTTLLSSLFVYPQIDEDFAYWEDTLSTLRSKVMSSPGEELRMALNEEFMTLFEEFLWLDGSFQHQWSADSLFSVVDSPDKLLRIYTWYIIKDDFTYENFGFLQFYNAGRKKYVIYPLYDRKNTLSYPEYEIGDLNQWYGAVYYQIIPLVHKKKTYYTLLGWNGNDLFTNEKVIEVLQFDPDSQSPVIFGAKIFKDYRSKVSRLIFKYSKEASLSLKYETHTYEVSTGKRDPKTKNMIYEVKSAPMIIFEELIPMEDNMPVLNAFLVPESSLNQGFIESKGEWRYITRVKGRNPDKKMRPRKFSNKQFYIN
ncbi:MAG TPA: hypothetical protein PLH70_07690 [Bacteroidales bacterium]|nr:hypothetical protein [Bacteroidales bacterium]HQB75665.1 hypothetical protein [Bacteroidales bacterium]